MTKSPWLPTVRYITPRLLGVLLIALASAGCAKSPGAPPLTPAQTTDAPATLIAPEDFATETHRLLLLSERDQKTKLLLAGAVQYQLSRAEVLFADGHTKEAEDVVAGALLLLRHDDELLSATRDRGTALLLAAHAAARKGDAGRAGALYELALPVLSDGAQKSDVKDHLRALKEYNESTAGPSALERVGQETRRALSRAVADPRAEAYTEARNGIIRWMHTALTSDAGKEQPESRAERELALEAYRAIRTGAPAMVALNLRQGSPRAAVDALDEADLDRALPPGVRTLLLETSGEQAPSAWLELFRQLDSLRNAGGSETDLPAYLAEGATFWAALGLYRSDAGSLEHALPLAMLLVEFGMPEVASTLLSQNASASSSAEALSVSLSVVLEGLLSLSQTGQLLAARRSYSEATKLLQLAEGRRLRRPGAARAPSLMAALETRHGYADRAIPLLEKSVKLESDPSNLLRLGQLKAQQGRTAEAKKTLSLALSQAQKIGDLLTESRALEELFRAHRDEGKQKEAATYLENALLRVLVLKNMEVTTTDAAQTERQLARLLVYYGDELSVRRAYERALVASRSNLVEVEITLTDMARAALVLGDVRLGRMATQQALDLGLPAENSIYIALWQQLLERRAESQPDGLTREVLSRAGKASGWLGTLRLFGLGEIKPDALLGAASGIPEKAEAEFYLAMSRAPGERSELKKVALSPAVDLIEVNIAQDLLSEGSVFPLPTHVKIP